MEMKFVILLLLAASFALFGCAKKGQTGNVTGNMPAAPGGETAPANGAGTAGNASSGSQGGSGATGDKNGNLSDLFNIDTGKPIGNEGFGTGTPSSDK
jgi:hypothetical protein